MRVYDVSLWVKLYDLICFCSVQVAQQKYYCNYFYTNILFDKKMFISFSSSLLL